MAQKFKFPMEYLRVTQGQLDAYSHAGSLAMDFGGRDGGADRLYAPCDMVVKRTRQNANGELYLESCEKVLFADGTTDYARLLCMHDGVFNVQQGQVIKQGEYFYDEGGMGGGRKNKFANHVHMEAGKGKWKSTTQSKNSYGTYVIENQASLYDLFILGSDVQLLSTGGYNWKRVTEPTAPLRSQDELAFFCSAKNHSLDYVDSGREREAEEGKVTSGQDRLQPVAERADNFSGHSGPLADGGVTAKQEREESHSQPGRCCTCNRCPCHSEAQSAEESHAHKSRCCPCGHCPCHSERSEESQNNKGRCCPYNHCPCHSEAQGAEESPAHTGGTLPKAETQPDSVCDTCQSSTAQYDSALICGCLCHSERSEESQNNKGSAQPDSICDTSQSSTAQYDSTLVCDSLCHSERSEESHNNPGSTLACTCPHTAQLYTENQSLKAIIEKIKQTVNGVNI